MMLEKKKLLIFSSSLAGGGAEMHLVRLLPFLQKEYNVTLGLARKEGQLLAFLPEGIEVVELGASRVLKAILPLARFIKKFKPDIILALQDHAAAVVLLSTWISGLKIKPKLVASIQMDIAAERRLSDSIKTRLLFTISPYILGFFDHLVGCSRGVVASLIKENSYLQRKTTTIYNAILDDSIIAAAKQECPDLWLQKKSKPVIVACGRLTKQKNFSSLIEAFKQVSEKLDCRLLIIGSGPEQQGLEDLINKLQLSESAKILPFTKNPYCYFSRADVFVLSSLWEGLGNVLVEAMACKLPVISSDCPSGPAEIIENNVSGVLVPVNDSLALAQAILSVLRDKETAQKTTEAGRQRAFLFSAQASAEQYLKVLAHV
ncbi:MAG: glycosyltransferase [Deltaproteobacteria bacterium]|nr:glycosyltransferase [Deltaproteobacteria bacterium]